MRGLRKHLDFLTCTQDQFEGLHASLAKTRSTSKTVTVDKASLTALLMDHSNLIDRVEKMP